MPRQRTQHERDVRDALFHLRRTIERAAEVATSLYLLTEHESSSVEFVRAVEMTRAGLLEYREQLHQAWRCRQSLSATEPSDD